MKFELNTCESKKYYNEVWYIASKYNKIKNNPKMKVYSLTNYRIMQIFGGILLCIICAFLSRKDTFYSVMLGFFGFYSLLILIITILNNSRLNEYLKNWTPKTIEIDNDGVHYQDDVKSFITKWDDIIYVIINKESICFLPKTNNNYIITMSIMYKDEVLKAINKYQKEELVVDNLK